MVQENVKTTDNKTKEEERRKGRVVVVRLLLGANGKGGRKEKRRSPSDENANMKSIIEKVAKMWLIRRTAFY